MHLCRSSSNVPCLPSFLEMIQNRHVLLTFEQVQNPLCLPRETTSNLEKWSVHGVLCTFWLGNVLRATTACTFRHRNFQKWSDAEVFCTFWLWNVLRATTACNFSSLIWPAGSAPAALASLLFDHPEPQIIGKHSASRLSYLFAHLHLLSSYSFSSTLLSSNLPLLSASSLLCFSSVHIVGSLTSKLPSNIQIYIYRYISYWITRILSICRQGPPPSWTLPPIPPGLACKELPLSGPWLTVMRIDRRFPTYGFIFPCLGQENWSLATAWDWITVRTK